ncbi:hypothetical protein SAMN02982990_00878 [Photorhabdus luminescens]|uniref:Uncharacterized protein n=1 Tax=Photorhabdus luminescens TaxID=29488 RepID=A0A1G5Q3N0_PHOLU|nr:hypothetical protein SAMN02982990_00878 [Photorhabdus luminescens]
MSQEKYEESQNLKTKFTPDYITTKLILDISSILMEHNIKQI